MEIAVTKERTDTRDSFIDIDVLEDGNVINSVQMIRMPIIEVHEKPRETIKKYVAKKLEVDKDDIIINEQKGKTLVDSME